ncbi:MAG TPA: hypothetical protein VLE23_05790 [Geminicoccaceae bacterium]|nr:hypothetical protein [Geminicoccaceae bacterium]
MRRRTALKLGLAGAAWLLGGAHTPYGQWQVYRRRHLMIGTSKADAPSYPLGRRVAEVLATHLPESSARVTRGPDAWRLASLITSGQLEVILLSTEHVLALRDGQAPFEAFGATRLSSLFIFGDHWLVCRPDFPGRHAYLVVETLATHGAMTIGGRVPDPAASPVPIHPGGLAYLRGDPLPAPAPADPGIAATAG